MKKILSIILFLLVAYVMSKEVAMPVFTGKKSTTNPQARAARSGIPAWMQSEKDYNPTAPNYGYRPPLRTVYGEQSQKRVRGNQVFVESPNEPKPTAKPLAPKPTVPAWLLQTQAWNPYPGQQQNPNPNLNYTPPPTATQQTTTPEQEWRRLNENGQYEYLQPDGSYLAAWGTAGVGTDSVRNSFASLPLYMQRPPLASQPAPAYSGFGSRYRQYGGGGGGGGGYGGYSNVPAWYLGLNSWNFSE